MRRDCIRQDTLYYTAFAMYVHPISDTNIPQLRDSETTH